MRTPRLSVGAGDDGHRYTENHPATLHCRSSGLLLIGVAMIAMHTASGAAAEASESTNPNVAMAPEDGQREAMSDAWWTGPLFAATPSTLPEGSFDIEPFFYNTVTYAQYDAEWSKMSTAHSEDFLSLWDFMYGLTNTLMIELWPRVGNNDPGGGSRSGLELADTTLRLHYRLTEYRVGKSVPTISIALDETFPTGKYDELRQPADALGPGITRPLCRFCHNIIFQPGTKDFYELDSICPVNLQIARQG